MSKHIKNYKFNLLFCTFAYFKMQNPIPYIVANNIFWMSVERGLFWEEKKTLVVADLHLGIKDIYTKPGLAIPQTSYTADLDRLKALLYHFKADKLLLIGDISQTKNKKQVDEFFSWRKHFSLLQIDVIQIKEDIITLPFYEEANIQLHKMETTVEGFRFRLDDKRFKDANKKKAPFTFYGHVHPVIPLAGEERKLKKYPCYYFTPKKCLLPAFSHYKKNGVKVQPQKNEFVYALKENELMQVV
ncbi:MAG: hypothetical protein KDC06_04365 [Chitinophagaceae bacterium]|nr:hypothetical protein [Chitinophagaceae bacterium]